AGRITIPDGLTLASAIGTSGLTTLGVMLGGTDTSSFTAAQLMYVGEQLVVDTGDNEETIELTGANSGNNQITGTFFNMHAAGVPVRVYGGFAEGVVPPGGNGSSGTKLKIFGDINGTGNMVYIEYECDVNAGRLYRRSAKITDAAKPPLTP